MSFDSFRLCYNTRPWKCDFPAIAGKYKGKKLVICGDGWNVWSDLESFGCKKSGGRGYVGKDGWDFMTINKLVETFPGNIEHAYSNEGESLNCWIAGRRREYQLEFAAKPNHAHSSSRGVTWRWPWTGAGTSALGGCLTAIALGYDLIVLAGIPLDNGPHNGEPYWRTSEFQTRDAYGTKNGVNHHWYNAIEHVFEDKIRSLSGRTKEWLGEP